MNCPINEQTADGTIVGQCCYYLKDGKTCPRHGDVSLEVERRLETGRCTLEDKWRSLRRLPPLGKETSE